HAGTVTCLSSSGSGTRVVSGSSDCTVRIWDIGSEHIIASRTGHTGGPVHAAAVSPNGRQIAYVNTEHEIRLWNPASAASIQTSPILSAERFVEIICIAYSPRGDHLAAGYGNGTIQIWETATRSPVRKPLAGHEDLVSAVAFSPDGLQVASASHDGTICIWYLGEGYTHAASQRVILRGHTSSVTSVCFSHDGARVVSGSADRTLRLWVLRDSLWQGEHLLQGHVGRINSVACAPSGTLVASASDDSTVRLWDAATGEPVGAPFRGHRGYVLSVSFVRDGTSLASGSGDKTIRFWDLGSLAA
ncbi:WD40 repeat-like protein, partial [Auricularia subglabra TFB-10046 SS5]